MRGGTWRTAGFSLSPDLYPPIGRKKNINKWGYISGQIVLEKLSVCDILKYIMPIGLPKLREIREAKRMSQRGLAKTAGITQAALFRLETGETDPRLSTLRRLAKALDVNVADLIGEGKPARTKRARR